MFLRKKTINQLISLVLFTLLLVGCTSNEKSVETQYYLSLKGESQTWNLTGYEVMINPDEFKAGNGTLHMKAENNYIADFFHFETHVVMNREDVVVHTGSVSGAGIDIAEETTGAIEGDTYLNDKGDAITLNEISAIYMVVEWQEQGETERVKERIDLYNKGNKEDTFLN